MSKVLIVVTAALWVGAAASFILAWRRRPKVNTLLGFGLGKAARNRPEWRGTHKAMDVGLGLIVVGTICLLVTLLIAS